MENWSAYVIGQGHVKNNTSCQDRTFKLVKKSNKGYFYGFGFSLMVQEAVNISDIGAEFITKKILYL